MSLFLKRLFLQFSIVSSMGTLVKSESMSKLPIKLLESWSTISVTKLNKYLTLYLLVVDSFKIGCKYFASFYVGVCKTNKIVLKSGQPLTHFMHFTKTIHYTRSSFYWFQISSCFFGHALRVFKKFLSMRFSWLVIKFKNSSSFKVVF